MSSPTARGSAAAALSAPVFPSVETEARMLHTNKPGTEAAPLHTNKPGTEAAPVFPSVETEAAPLHTNKPGAEAAPVFPFGRNDYLRTF